MVVVLLLHGLCARVCTRNHTVLVCVHTRTQCLCVCVCVPQSACVYTHTVLVCVYAHSDCVCVHERGKQAKERHVTKNFFPPKLVMRAKT